MIGGPAAVIPSLACPPQPRAKAGRGIWAESRRQAGGQNIQYPMINIQCSSEGPLNPEP